MYTSPLVPTLNFPFNYTPLDEYLHCHFDRRSESPPIHGHALIIVCWNPLIQKSAYPSVCDQTNLTLTSRSATSVFVDKCASFCIVNPWIISSILCTYQSLLCSFRTNFSETVPSLLFIILTIQTCLASRTMAETASEIRFSYNRMFCLTAKSHPIHQTHTSKQFRHSSIVFHDSCLLPFFFTSPISSKSSFHLG